MSFKYPNDAKMAESVNCIPCRGDNKRNKSHTFAMILDLHDKVQCPWGHNEELACLQVFPNIGQLWEHMDTHFLSQGIRQTPQAAEAWKTTSSFAKERRFNTTMESTKCHS